MYAYICMHIFWHTVKIPNGWNCVEATPSAKDQSWHHEEDEEKEQALQSIAASTTSYTSHLAKTLMNWEHPSTYMHANIHMDMCRCQKQVANTPTTGLCVTGYVQLGFDSYCYQLAWWVQATIFVRGVKFNIPRSLLQHPAFESEGAWRTVAETFVVFKGCIAKYFHLWGSL